MRERAKRVTYGIVYGLSAFGLAQQLSGQGVTKESAQQMINSFLSRFAGCPLNPLSLGIVNSCVPHSYA
jgi:DNA polymerase I-like protein with 3'-5' exonuclease and polymerase domains